MVEVKKLNEVFVTGKTENQLNQENANETEDEISIDMDMMVND